MGGPLIGGFNYDRVVTGNLNAGPGVVTGPAAGTFLQVPADGGAVVGVGLNSATGIMTVLLEGSVDAAAFADAWLPIEQWVLPAALQINIEAVIPVAGYSAVRLRTIAYTSGSAAAQLEMGSGPYHPSLDYGLRTYEATLSGIALGVTAFDQVLFTPSTVYAARIAELEVIYHGATAAGAARLEWVLESVAQTGGTLGTAAPILKEDQNDKVSGGVNGTLAALQQYTTQTTGGGTDVAKAAAGLLGVAAAIGAGPSQIWTKRFDIAKPLIVKPGQFLALRSPAAAAAGSVASVRVRWMER